MAGHGAALVFDLVARGNAPSEFVRLAGAADKAASATLRASAGLETASARMAKVGATLSKSLTLPLLALGAVSVGQAAKYQKSLNTIQVATDQTNRQMAESSKGLLALSTSTGTGLGQLTDGLYTVEKSGLRGARALAVVRAAAQGAKAENADLGVVTDGLTSIMASYGSKLRDPVKAMDMIVRGAGLAKTTIQDFTSSLANVVPIASSLGISFADVGGAIATMTQHGETAQRATENLSNLITNLAGQNSVASASLNQLGVNTIDLSQNLGKRGLVGSLDLVLDAIGKHKLGGKIVVDSFRASATAASALRSELAKMDPALAKQSAAFDTGALSFKNYNAFIKSLGGQQYALGKGFIATEAQAKGFNKQLVSGNGNVSTLARTLQKSLGGVTGMRTALMLSGESAKLFADNSKQIGKAAEESGVDVLGWSKTQGLFTTKVDKAKASLQVLAVEIGSALIPAVSKVVGWVTKGVHWFSQLSGGTKKFLGIAALVAVALGPVLSVFGRLVTLQGRVQGAFARTASVVVGSGRTSAGAMAGQALAAQQSAAAFAEAEALKARATADSAVAIAASLRGTDSVLAADSLAAARDAEAWAVAMRVRADAAVRSAAVATAAFEREGAAARSATVAGAGAGRAGFMRGGGALGVGLVGGMGLQYAGAQTGGQTGSSLNAIGTGGMIGSFFGPAGLAGGAAAGGIYSGIKTLQMLPGIVGPELTGKLTGTFKMLDRIGKVRAHPKIAVDTTAAQGKIKAAQKTINEIRQGKIPWIRANTDAARWAIGKLQAEIRALRDKTVTITVGVNYDYGANVHGAVNDLVPGATPTTSSPRSAAQQAAGLGRQRSAAQQVAAQQAASDAKAAAQQAAADAKAAAQARADAFKSAYETKLANARSRLATVQGNYNNAKSAVRSAYTGTFDIASAGGNQFGEPVTFAAIKRQLDKAVANAKRFTSALRKLQQEGLGTYLLQQLADAGPAALPQALALLSATPKQIKALSYEYRSLGRSGDTAGTRIADDMYGAGVQSAQGLVNGLLSKQGAVNNAVKNLADGMMATLRTELDMHSPSKRLFNEGALAFEGYRQGIQSKYGAIEDAAAGAGAKSIPGRGGGSSQVGGPAIGELHLHYSHPDDYHRATATAMRAATTVLR